MGYLGTGFDITERKLAETEMRLDTELFQAVIEVQQAVAAAGLDSATVMRVIAERCRALTGATGVVVELIQGDELVPQVTIGIESPRLRLSGQPVGLACAPATCSARTTCPTDPRIGHDAYHTQGIRSLLAVPLRDDQRILGVLKVLSPDPAAFSDRDAKALRLLGGLVGASLEHASAFEARQGRLEDRTQALQESEQRFKQLVDVAQEGIWVSDDRGVITYVNQRMTDLLGYQNGALLGRPVYDFLDATARAGRSAAGAAPARAARATTSASAARTATEVWGLVSASPVAGRDGAPVGMVGMVTDITERKRTEERLRRSAERLAVLHDLDQAILAARSPAEIGRAALGRMRRMVPCHRCTVVLFDFPRGQAQLIAGYAAGSAISARTMPMTRSRPARCCGAARCASTISARSSRPRRSSASCATKGSERAHRPAAGGRRSHRRDQPRLDHPARFYRRAPRHRGGDRGAARDRHPAGAAARGARAADRRARAARRRAERGASGRHRRARDDGLRRFPRPARPRSATSAASASSCSTTPARARSGRTALRPPHPGRGQPHGRLVDDLVHLARVTGRMFSAARWNSPRWSRTW